MKRLAHLSLALLSAFALAAPQLSRAGEQTAVSTAVSNGVIEEEDTGFAAEFDAEAAFVGESDFERGFKDVNNVDEFHHLLRFVYTPRIMVGILRLGIEWENYAFGHGSDLLPDNLQSVSAVVGLDTKFSDSILVRIQANPGFYGSDDIDGDTFMVPFILGGSYIYNPSLQFVLGVSVNVDREWPVLPGLGVRWRMSSQWVLNAVLPNPRLEYEVTKQFKLYGGASLKGGTYRVDEDFGFDRRHDMLPGPEASLAQRDRSGRYNHAVLDYREIRLGGGLEWQVTPWLSFMAEGGFAASRSFDFHRVDAKYRAESGAPYGAIALHGEF